MESTSSRRPAVVLDWRRGELTLLTGEPTRLLAEIGGIAAPAAVVATKRRARWGAGCEMYMLAPMACARTARHPPPVFPGAKRFGARRDPDNELYDRACELVESAAAVRQAAADPDAADAFPAVLGCIETALRDLASVAGTLERATTEQDTPRVDPRQRARAARGYRNLQVILGDATAAARAAQALAARVARR